MKKEIMTYTTVCDICEEELKDSYFKTNKFDLCYSCAGKLFSFQIGDKIPDDKLQDMIHKTKLEFYPDMRNHNEVKKEQKINIGVRPEFVLKLEDL